MKENVKTPCASGSIFGCSSVGGCSPCPSGGGSSGGSSSSPSGGIPYHYLQTYPTRNGATYIMYTWNTEGKDVSEIISVKLYITKTQWNKIKTNATWQLGDDNPYSESTEDVKIINVYEGDGELGRYWSYEDSNYSVFLSIQFRDSNGQGWLHPSYFTRPCQKTYDNYITESAPNIDYNNGRLTINPLVSGRRIIEFRRTDISYGSSTGISDEETLNEMFFASFLNAEVSDDGVEVIDNPYKAYYDLYKNPKLYRWRKNKTYTVYVSFPHNSTRNKSRILSAINEAVYQINSVMEEFGITFLYRPNNASGDIEVIVDSEENLFGIDIYNDPDYVMGGVWSTDKDSDGYIYGATVCLACDFQDGGAYFASYETIAFEELLQCMGAGYDQIEYPYDTIHTDFNYYNKSSTMYSKDADILRLVYADEVNAGDLYCDVCRKLNIPKGAYLVSSSTSNRAYEVDMSLFADRGGTYDVRVFIVNSRGEVSGTSGWLTDIVVPEIIVDPWSWNASNGSASAQKTRQFYNVLMGNALPENGFSYLVWNDLVDKIDEVITAYGKSWNPYCGYGKDGCKVTNGEALSASKYNEVRVQIGSIISTGITDRSLGDEIQGRYITILTDNINSIISTML